MPSGWPSLTQTQTPMACVGPATPGQGPRARVPWSWTAVVSSSHLMATFVK